jgi:hypothetical protein
VLEAVFEMVAQALFPDWPSGRKGMVAAWVMVGVLAVVAVVTFMRDVPRAPAACAAGATALAGLLVMGPLLERANERRSRLS